MITKLPDLAYEILELISIHTSLSQDQIQDMLDVNKKEVKYAIRRLQENNIVQQIPDLLDMRTVNYRFPTDEEYAMMKSKVAPSLLEQLEDIMQVNIPTEVNFSNENASV